MSYSHFVSAPSAGFIVRRLRRPSATASSTGAGLGAQSFEVAGPCLLPNVIPGNVEGLLLRIHADNDVAVHIPYEAFFTEYDPIELIVGDGYFAVEPINPGDQRPTIIRHLPGPLGEGRYTVTYQVASGVDWKVYEGYPGQPLRIDRTAPGGSVIAGLEFSQQVIDFGVTAADLVADVLSVDVPAWTDMEDGDWVEPYYQLNPLTGASFSIGSAAQQVGAGGAGQRVTLGIPLAQLLAMGDGVRWFGYVLRDLAGNASALRPVPVPVDIRLLDIPINLRPPRIARYDDDGVISEADARGPVEVVIPGFDKASPGDEIVFVLGSARSARLRINEDDAGEDPIMAFSIAYAMVASGGGAGAPERYSAEAYYEVYRGTELLATSPLPNSVTVDITTPAGPDPDPATPINESLRLATVRGASGVDNVISATDTLHAATVFIPFHADNQASPPVGRAYLEVDDVIKVRWGELELSATLTIDDGHLNRGAPLEITATSAEIISQGPGSKAVSYSVLRAIVGTSPAVFNTSLADQQSVAVSSADWLPGGPDGIAHGDFAERNTSDALNRDNVETDGGTPYRVMLNYLNVALNDRIVIHLQGHDDLAGNGTETPNTTYSDFHVLREEDLPTDENPNAVHDFLIPTHYFASKWTTPIRGRGSVVGRHTITNAIGAVEAPLVTVIVGVADL